MLSAKIRSDSTHVESPGLVPGLFYFSNKSPSVQDESLVGPFHNAMPAAEKVVSPLRFSRLLLIPPQLFSDFSLSTVKFFLLKNWHNFLSFLN